MPFKNGYCGNILCWVIWENGASIVGGIETGKTSRPTSSEVVSESQYL